jgi:hypothetical protein
VTSFPERVQEGTWGVHAPPRLPPRRSPLPVPSIVKRCVVSAEADRTPSPALAGQKLLTDPDLASEVRGGERRGLDFPSVVRSRVRTTCLVGMTDGVSGARVRRPDRADRNDIAGSDGNESSLFATFFDEICSASALVTGRKRFHFCRPSFGGHGPLPLQDCRASGSVITQTACALVWAEGASSRTGAFTDA